MFPFKQIPCQSRRSHAGVVEGIQGDPRLAVVVHRLGKHLWYPLSGLAARVYFLFRAVLGHHLMEMLRTPH